jgi:hypothetical protein
MSYEHIVCYSGEQQQHLLGSLYIVVRSPLFRPSSALAIGAVLAAEAI